jgi:hypothetical protein
VTKVIKVCDKHGPALMYAATKDAHEPALMYAALGKKAVLQGLFRSSGNKKVRAAAAQDVASRWLACDIFVLCLG